MYRSWYLQFEWRYISDSNYKKCSNDCGDNCYRKNRSNVHNSYCAFGKCCT